MNFKVILSFALVYVIWGSTYTAIKYGLESFPPFLLASLRFALAGLSFLVLSRGKGFRGMTIREYSREMVIGILITSANAGVCWAEQYLSSGVASLIVGMIPVLFILFNWIGFEKKPPQLISIVGLLIGVAGVVLISTDATSVSNWLIVAGLMLANGAWVIASLMMRTGLSPRPYLVKASVQLLSGALFLASVSWLIGERETQWRLVQLSGYMSVIYLAFFGTIVAYTSYSYLLKNVRPELTSTYALVNPLVALLIGVVWLNEAFTVQVAVSTALILCSVSLVIYGRSFFNFLRSRIKF
jgi:drug/metabolite transporter (DMT)-like permease